MCQRRVPPVPPRRYGFDGNNDRSSQDVMGGDYSNWNYGGTRQLGSDLYYVAWGLSPLTLPQWELFSADDWDTLPVDVLGAYTYLYAYSPVGNRLTQSDPDSGEIITNTFNAANRLLASTVDSDTTTYTYDANGNQLTIEEPGGDITTNTWDGENRLIQVEHPGGDIVTYAYNGDGLRVSLDDGVEVVRYVYDGNNVLQETDDTGAVTAEYTYQPGEYGLTISQHRDGDSSFHLFDGIHNTAGLTDGTGTVTDEYQSDAFGESRSSTGATPNPHVYKGEYNAYYKDPLAGPGDSIYSLHHRQYEATTGRFKSQDPIADDLNLYRYVGNNPVNAVDPSGLEDTTSFPGQSVVWTDTVPHFYKYTDQFGRRVYDPPLYVKTVDALRRFSEEQESLRSSPGKPSPELQRLTSKLEVNRRPVQSPSSAIPIAPTYGPITLEEYNKHIRIQELRNQDPFRNVQIEPVPSDEGLEAIKAMTNAVRTRLEGYRMSNGFDRRGYVANIGDVNHMTNDDWKVYDSLESDFYQALRRENEYIGVLSAHNIWIQHQREPEWMSILDTLESYSNRNYGNPRSSVLSNQLLLIAQKSYSNRKGYSEGGQWAGDFVRSTFLLTANDIEKSRDKWDNPPFTIDTAIPLVPDSLEERVNNRADAMISGLQHFLDHLEPAFVKYVEDGFDRIIRGTPPSPERTALLRTFILETSIEHRTFIENAVKPAFGQVRGISGKDNLLYPIPDLGIESGVASTVVEGSANAFRKASFINAIEKCMSNGYIDSRVAQVLLDAAKR